jgi:hypothetical protein
MFGNDHFASVKESFADQFEQTDQGMLVYRKNQKGPAIRVTPEEFDRFTDDYARRIRYSSWGMVGSLLVFIGIVIGWTVLTNSDLPQFIMYVGMGAIAGASVAYMMHARGAPARELEARTPIAGERSKGEMRAVMLRKISYGQLAGTAAASFVIVLGPVSKHGLSGWNRLWLLFPAAVVAATGIQAFRKWRFEREHPNDVY